MRAAARARSAERGQRRAHKEISGDGSELGEFQGLHARERHATSTPAASAWNSSSSLLTHGEMADRFAVAISSGIRARDDRDVVAVFLFFFFAALKLEVARRQRMLVVNSSDLFIDGAQVSRIRSCEVCKAAQVAGGRIIGLGRDAHAHRHRRDPREKELQDQRACHFGDAQIRQGMRRAREARGVPPRGAEF